MPDRTFPEVADAETARTALKKHSANALEGLEWEYDGDRTIYVKMPAINAQGKAEEYLVRLTFLYYPDWPPSVTFLNPETKRYDGTHWPRTGSSSLAMHPNYGGAPSGMVCNSMTFEYYFWGGHQVTENISWQKGTHTFAATIAELKDHLKPPFYQGRAT